MLINLFFKRLICFDVDIYLDHAIYYIEKSCYERFTANFKYRAYYAK